MPSRLRGFRGCRSYGAGVATRERWIRIEGVVPARAGGMTEQALAGGGAEAGRADIGGSHAAAGEANSGQPGREDRLSDSPCRRTLCPPKARARIPAAAPVLRWIARPPPRGRSWFDRAGAHIRLPDPPAPSASPPSPVATNPAPTPATRVAKTATRCAGPGEPTDARCWPGHAASSEGLRAIVGRAQPPSGLAHDPGAAARRSHRLCANALRANKDMLVRWSRGDGQVHPRRRRVQEMIDSRFRRRSLAPALRPDHALRAPGHRCTSSGTAGHRRDHLASLPVGGWAWNAFIARRSAETSRSGSPRQDTACGDRVDARLNEALRDGGFPGSVLPVQRHRQRAVRAHGRRQARGDDQLPGSTKVGRQVGERVARRMGRRCWSWAQQRDDVDETADLNWRSRDRVRAVGTAASAARPRAASSSTSRSLTTCSAISRPATPRRTKIGDPTTPPT